MTTLDVDRYVERRILELGAEPSFKEQNGFPASTCININEEVENAIPNSKKIIVNGDLLKIVVGASVEGYHCKSTISICLGPSSKKAERISTVAKDALCAGLSTIKPGNTLLDVAGAIEDLV